MIHNKDFKKLKDSDGVTYVNGLGFIGGESNNSNHDGIRRLSLLICTTLLVYFFCEWIFVMPATNMASFLGFDVRVNHLTGMITASAVSRIVVSFFTSFASFVCCIGLAFLLTARDVTLSMLFCRPAYGVTSVAVPIILSVSILGGFLANAFNSGVAVMGMILPSATNLTASRNIPQGIASLAVSIFICVLEEILFSGVLLATLRRYGDDFAIITTAMLFALFQASVAEMILGFFLSLCICYFVVRSGSVFVAIIGRIVIVLYNFFTSLCVIFVEEELAFVIISLLALTVIAIAGGSYIYFLRQDKHAFLLKQPLSAVSLRRRIVTFVFNPMFVVFCSIMGVIALTGIEIIG